MSGLLVMGLTDEVAPKERRDSDRARALPSYRSRRASGRGAGRASGSCPAAWLGFLQPELLDFNSALRLTKYQALGNDYLVLDLPAPVAEVIAAAPLLCDRHRGVGADG